MKKDTCPESVRPAAVDPEDSVVVEVEEVNTTPCIFVGSYYVPYALRPDNI